jgi:hypothetical protein
VDHNNCSLFTAVEDNQALNPYAMFKYSIRSDTTRKYYERRLRRFLDFLEFHTDTSDMEKRCDEFVQLAKHNPNWALNNVIKFLQHHKERVEKGEITAGTLRNFVKSLKSFGDSADLNIP